MLMQELEGRRERGVTKGKEDHGGEAWDKEGCTARLFMACVGMVHLKRGKMIGRRSVRDDD